jgi:transposase
MGFITADRKQMELLGYSVDELVELTSRPRFIVDLVDQLDLKEVYDSYSDQGGDALEPSILLATWFLAYCEGITSTRQIEKLCRRDLHYIYISAHLRPDHCGLSRFRQWHAQRLPSIFVQIVRLVRYGYKERKRGRLLFVYRASQCKDCALRRRCLTKPENPESLRTIRRDSQEHLAEQMLTISQSAQGKQRLKRRAQSVEPVFGNLKHNLGFRRFNLQGMTQAQGEFSLMCIAHNILKWEKLSPSKGNFWSIMHVSCNAISITARSYLNIFTPRQLIHECLFD